MCWAHYLDFVKIRYANKLDDVEVFLSLNLFSDTMDKATFVRYNGEVSAILNVAILITYTIHFQLALTLSQIF